MVFVMLGTAVVGVSYNIAASSSLSTSRFDDAVPDKECRVLAVGGDWIARHIGNPLYFTWRNHGSSVPVEVLYKAFSFDEICRIWWFQVTQSRLSEHIEKYHPLLEKIRLSFFHHGAGKIFNAFTSAANGLSELAWPGAEVRLVHTGAYRCDGPAEGLPEAEKSIWLDNDFGALIYVGGKHVLTVGFGVGEHGVYLAQVQLRQAKGNRFLYRLPAHQLDVSLSMLARAFPDRALWLVDGVSAVSANRRSYGKSKCHMSAETDLRITALYDRSLHEHVRTHKQMQHWDRNYRQLKKAVRYVVAKRSEKYCDAE